ncbi:IS110 family transposase [Streptantibioticus ferralitis]|uniref:IS110 family transposase n=1 Tax=Streptantibioticus ferralitis TaxID=236510 RepID=A0ABT5Z8P8_9ACTN|nr:IS110 family transposase [Streptantibioticus ferralitis]MDF2260202.1 IS110 family transposase [Streptantibioticus ferralitis]
MDTHRDAHVAAVLSPVGALIGTEEFPATAVGYRELLKWTRVLGTVRRAGAEGTGSFGAALSRYLLTQGVEVLDVNRPDRTDRRQRGKSDPLDAQNAARAVLSGRARAQAKSGDGPVQIARMYKLAKGSAVKARTQAINQLKAVLVSADPNLREELARLNNSELFRTCARLADDSRNDEGDEEEVLQATRITLCLLAGRIGQLSEQIQDLEGRLARLVERHAPQLLTVVGIGPDTAAILLITMGDNPDRLGSEASFAALCGVSPIERSSGSRQYRRLNRGGDRHAALHRIVQTRLRFDPRTQDYYERRIKEGKTRREIVRCLKRYAAREVFHLVRRTQSCPPS